MSILAKIPKITLCAFPVGALISAIIQFIVLPSSEICLRWATGQAVWFLICAAPLLIRHFYIDRKNK